MRLWKRFLGVSLLSCYVYADDIDVFGVDDVLAERILKRYGYEVLTFEKQLFELRKKARSSALLKNYQHYQQQLAYDIAHAFHLPGVRFDSVYYPDGRLYTTIDVYRTKENVKQSPIYHPQKPYDIIDKMILFKHRAVDFYLKHPSLSFHPKCLDIHCIAPDHPETQDYLKYFREKVPKHQAEIKSCLAHDAYIERRRAAIFLLAYLSNHSEIPKILNTLIEDENRFIQHDALRLWGEYLQHYPESVVDIGKIIRFLSVDDVAIRNKALILIESIANQSRYQARLTREAGQPLLRLLKLKQPNNHRLAYHILCQLSHQKWGAREYLQWENWLHQSTME